MTDLEKRLQAYAEFFESLTPAQLQQFDVLFSGDARFKDPFNDVRGVDAIRRVFAHMFAQCERPRFEVLDYCGSGDRGYLEWTFHFRLKGGASEQQIHGLSQVTFARDGRISEHIDYWDPAEQIYARLPVLGWILGQVRKRLSA
jgi:ketosteroid isomerase-like protein